MLAEHPRIVERRNVIAVQALRAWLEQRGHSDDPRANGYVEMLGAIEFATPRFLPGTDIDSQMTPVSGQHIGQLLNGASDREAIDTLTDPLQRHQEMAPVCDDRFGLPGTGWTPNPGQMYARRYGARSDTAEGKSTAEIGAMIRADLKAAAASGWIPDGLEYSVRCDSFAGGSAINVTAKNLQQSWLNQPAPDWHQFPGTPVRTSQAVELARRITGIVEAYNYDGSETQSDYFDVRFYSNVSLTGPEGWASDHSEKATKRRLAKAATSRFAH